MSTPTDPSINRKTGFEFFTKPLERCHVSQSIRKYSHKNVTVKTKNSLGKILMQQEQRRNFMTVSACMRSLHELQFHISPGNCKCNTRELRVFCNCKLWWTSFATSGVFFLHTTHTHAHTPPITSCVVVCLYVCVCAVVVGVVTTYHRPFVHWVCIWWQEQTAFNVCACDIFF